MADTKSPALEREYIVPLRRHWLNVPQYERTGKAVKALKQFIAKHMKVTDRNPDLVKIDVYFNNELWFRGRTNPPAKVKVRARKEGDLVHVSFVETPQHIAFLQAKHARRHTKAEKKAPTPETKPDAIAQAEQKTEEQKTEEKEKEKSVADIKMKEAEQHAKAHKHATKISKAQHPQRMALKK
jgi:large subunit ribosomal protein L31e